MAPKQRRRRSFGAVRKLPSGRYQASYLSPDTGERIKASHTFETKLDADTWLSLIRADITRGEWNPSSKKPAVQFGDFGRSFIARGRYSDRTRYLYQTTFERDLEETFGKMPLRSIKDSDVTQWYDALDSSKPAKRAQAYRVLRTILNAAVDADRIVRNPCRIKGAAQAEGKRNPERITAEDMAALSEQMPPEYALAVPLAAFGALRAGEVLGLQRGDINIKERTVDVRRSAGTTTPGAPAVGPLKTRAAHRTIVLPSFIVDALAAQLNAYVGAGERSYIFPSAANDQLPVTYMAFRNYFSRACAAIGRPQIHFHDLRHAGALMAAHSGATVKELMHRLGHTSARMALHYQAATQQRDRAIADALDKTYGEGPTWPTD